MSRGVQSIRGMQDILPAEAPYWQTLEAMVSEVFAAYGYQPVRLPLLERTELFKRAVGEVTDIVEKEMYTFDDRGGDSVSLRPEATAGCVRAVIENGLLRHQTPRLWYTGPMFRYERPQKGRYRQFHQFGVETFGLAGPDVDAEQIAMGARLWQRLGITGIHLEINTLGTPEERAAYRDKLVAYFRSHADALDEDSKRRLETNPLRILDSKNPELRTIIDNAPTLAEALGEESTNHFANLKSRLDSLGIGYRVNPRLVRGLDYYTRTVFEWLTDDLGAQDAVCSGGRYDGLVAQLGGPDTPAVGFALGVERLIALMQAQEVSLRGTAPHVYVVLQGEAAEAAAPALVESLRDDLPTLRLQVHAGGGSFKSQFKRADRSGAELAIILGDAEIEHDNIQLKPLRTDAAQESVSREQLAARLATWLNLDKEHGPG